MNNEQEGTLNKNLLKTNEQQKTPSVSISGLSHGYIHLHHETTQALEIEGRPFSLESFGRVRLTLFHS